MVTTNRVVSGVPWRRRMMKSSMAQPNSGASTSSTAARAIGAGQFHPNRICQ